MKDFIDSQIEKLSVSYTTENFLELSGVENSMIVLEVPLIDYSLTELARIIESNSARVINLMTLLADDGNTLIISIKLNIIDVSPVMMSLERFNYKILFYKMKEGAVTDTHKERLDELLYYLDM